MTGKEIQEEQNKQPTNCKSPWRFVFLAAALYGIWELLGNLAARFLYLFVKDPFLLAGEASSIGIIGGADGPTAIFITTPGWTHWVVPALALAVGTWGFLRLRKCKQK